MPSSPSRLFSLVAFLALVNVVHATDASAQCVGGAPDGVVATSEGCDDGNAVSGDGCGATCRVEGGWSCDRPVSFTAIGESNYPGANANWIVSNGGRQGEQTVNTGHGTVGLILAEGFASTYTFRFRVNTTADDDFVGFVFGFNPGDAANAAADYLLLDWKQANQTAAGFGTATLGMALSRVQGIPTASNLWTHTGAVTEIARAATRGAIGWADNTDYTVVLSYTPTLLTVRIAPLTVPATAPVTEFLLTPAQAGYAGGTFPAGELGFYGFSQPNAQYELRGPFGLSSCNQAPSVQNHERTRVRGSGPLNVVVTSGFTDPNGNGFNGESVTVVAAPATGSAAGPAGGAPTGSVRVSPAAPDVVGVQTLTYRLCDDHPTIPLCSTATVTVTTVECLSDTHCSGASPRCDVATNICVECLGVADCNDANECTTDACTANVCSNTANAVGSACAGGVCDGAAPPMCVECVADAQCSGSTPLCDTASSACVACLSGSDCSDGNQCTMDMCTAGICSNPAEASGAACTGGFCDGAAMCDPTCGDGMQVGAETCDDGNTTSGDGCSALCRTEGGFMCTGTPSVCDAVCGDGTLAGAEACDDGGTMDNDGCSAMCTIEPGYTCTGMPAVCDEVCGDGIQTVNEMCDDGNTRAGDGCDDSCSVERGFLCTLGTSIIAPSRCLAQCGDGILAGAELCDDGNRRPLDGCSATCNPEFGWTCMGEPSACAAVCGDGYAVPGQEACDDGNLMGGDGCTDMCMVESGYGCTGRPSVCDPLCGDGLITGGEDCDDGNGMNGDGCSDIYQTETGYTCEEIPSTCELNCGNGMIDVGELCDDGNTVAGDGCSNVCETEAGYMCG